MGSGLNILVKTHFWKKLKMHGNAYAIVPVCIVCDLYIYLYFFYNRFAGHLNCKSRLVKPSNFTEPLRGRTSPNCERWRFFGSLKMDVFTFIFIICHDRKMQCVIYPLFCAYSNGSTQTFKVTPRIFKMETIYVRIRICPKYPTIAF